SSSGVTASNKSRGITLNPCGSAGTLSLSVATSTRVDCSAGGTTVTLAGNGASYLIVPQFPTDQVPVSYVNYQMYTGNVAAASASISRLPGRANTVAAGRPEDDRPARGREIPSRARGPAIRRPYPACVDGTLRGRGSERGHRARGRQHSQLSRGEQLHREHVGHRDREARLRRRQRAHLHRHV